MWRNFRSGERIDEGREPRVRRNPSCDIAEGVCLFAAFRRFGKISACEPSFEPGAGLRLGRFLANLLAERGSIRAWPSARKQAVLRYGQSLSGSGKDGIFFALLFLIVSASVRAEEVRIHAGIYIGCRQCRFPDGGHGIPARAHRGKAGRAQQEHPAADADHREKMRRRKQHKRKRKSIAGL